MFLLNAVNPVYDEHRTIINKVRTFGKYFTPLFKIIREDNTLKLSRNAFTGGLKDGKYIFAAEYDSLVSSSRKTIPSRLVVKMSNVTRLWILDSFTKTGHVIYKSLAGDKLVLNTK